MVVVGLRTSVQRRPVEFIEIADPNGTKTDRPDRLSNLEQPDIRSDENFAVVDSDTQRLNDPEAAWSKLICENCGAMNFVTARTCSRCGIYLHGEREVIPVE